MSTGTRELIELCEKLPEAQREEVVDFARFLLARADDAAWEKAIAQPKPRPALDDFLKTSREEGSQPLDLERL
jgi:hypothetical protein